jgi:hypothetical protein
MYNNFFNWYSGGGGVESNWFHSALRPSMAYCASPGWLWRWRNLWNDWQGKPKYSKKTLPQCRYVHHKHTCLPGREPRPLRWEASVWSPLKKLFLYFLSAYLRKRSNIRGPLSLNLFTVLTKILYLKKQPFSLDRFGNVASSTNSAGVQANKT